ncbi:MAG TPA: BtpA/SgcQ family protein [Thermotogales bacterium]|nr:BtpA/SgcQ family protein [Thermotogales bacterium]
MFGKKPFVIGMVHCRPLPGSEKYEKGSFRNVIKKAIEEAKMLEENGVDGIQIENMWDRPYRKGKEIGYETVASLAVVASEVRHAVDIPIGINCHLNGGLQALAVAVAVEARWIRVFAWVNAYISNAGFIEGIASEVLRYRKILLADDQVKILADIRVKHGSHFIVNDRSLVEHAKDAEEYHADAIIVTGSETGSAPKPEEVKQVKEAVSIPVFIGSGLTSENVYQFLPHIDGCIVGSYFKHDGKWYNEMDPSRIRKFMKIIDEYRKNSN